VLRRKQDQDKQNGRLSQQTVPWASPVTGVTISPAFLLVVARHDQASLAFVSVTYQLHKCVGDITNPNEVPMSKTHLNNFTRHQGRGDMRSQSVTR
jgi:hypothetical protein